MRRRAHQWNTGEPVTLMLAITIPRIRRCTTSSSLNGYFGQRSIRSNRKSSTTHFASPITSSFSTFRSNNRREHPITIPTAAKYFKGFASIFGFLAGATSVLPVVGPLLASDWSFYFFPPLPEFLKTATVVLSLATTFLVYFLHTAKFMDSKRGRVKALGWMFGAAVVGIVLYLFAHSAFVRTIDGQATTVVVGYERTQFADDVGGGSDWDLLRKRGPVTEEIEKLWTPTSVYISRALLLLSYLLFLLPVVTLFSLGVLYSVSGVASNP